MAWGASSISGVDTTIRGVQYGGIENNKPMTTTKPRKITATAENGQAFTRRTARNYSHAIYLEFTYSDGRVENVEPSYCGRPDLAAKTLKQAEENAAARQGTEVCIWDQENRVYVGTGIFRTKVRAVCVPVNA